MFSEVAEMRELTWQQTRQMLLFVADEIIAQKPFLTEIDSKIGDGDHGIGMETGMKKVKAKLAATQEGTDVYQLLSETGKAMLMSMGGASGVIFGTMFLGGAKGKTPSATLDCGGMTAWLADSLAQIQLRGKAEVGDKTMVDALAPAVAAMQGYDGGDLTVMLRLAEEAALGGVEATKSYQAKFGRAKSLMERAVGYQDAGATSVWLILRAMREYTEKAGSEQ